MRGERDQREGEGVIGPVGQHGARSMAHGEFSPPDDPARGFLMSAFA